MTLNRIARTAPAMLAATLLVALSPARTALAQNISDAVVTASPVTPAGKVEIKNFIAAQAPGLSGPDATTTTIRRSKNSLSAPLNNTGMSESFRREFGTQLLPVITPLASSPKEEVAINALRLAGLVGTKDGLDLVVKSLDDKRSSVRFAAAMNAGLSISTGRAANSRALSPRNATEALDSLNEKLAAEKDPRVVDALILAIDDAMKVKEADLPDVRKKATAYLLLSTKRLAATLGTPALDQAYSHAVKSIGEALLDNGPDKLSAPSMQEAACVAGDVLAAVLRRLDAVPTDAERSLLGLIAQQCERIVQQSAVALGAKAPIYNLDELLHESKDPEFKAAAQRLFRDLGVDPFACKPADRYPAAKP